MIARTELRIRDPRTPRLVRVNAADPLEIGPNGHRQAYAYRRGLIIIGLLTAWFLGWLIVRWLVQPGWFAGLPAFVSEIVALVETAWAFTLAFLWAALGWQYRRRQLEEQTPAPQIMTIEKLQSLSPQAFERYVAGLFRQKGYKVVLRGSSGDLGVDLELTGPQGRRAIVQCKRYQNTIGAEIVRELFGTMIHEGVMWAFLVTTAEISEAARDWATGKPITLIDGATLLEVAWVMREKNLDAASAALEVDI